MVLLGSASQEVFMCCEFWGAWLAKESVNFLTSVECVLKIRPGSTVNA